MGTTGAPRRTRSLPTLSSSSQGPHRPETWPSPAHPHHIRRFRGRHGSNNPASLFGATSPDTQSHPRTRCGPQATLRWDSIVVSKKEPTGASRRKSDNADYVQAITAPEKANVNPFDSARSTYPPGWHQPSLAVVSCVPQRGPPKSCDSGSNQVRGEPGRSISARSRNQYNAMVVPRYCMAFPRPAEPSWLTCRVHLARCSSSPGCWSQTG